MNESLLKIDANSKKYFKYLQIKDTYKNKSPVRYHRRFNSTYVGNQNKLNEKRAEIQKNGSYLNNSMLGDEHLYSRDMSYNKENNDLGNLTAILNHNSHFSNLKIDENSDDQYATGNSNITKPVEDIVNNEIFEKV